MANTPHQGKFSNTLLESFDSELIARLHLTPVTFKAGQRIEEPGKPIRHLYFLESGMTSMTTLFRNGSEVEVGMFGNESVIGVSALMGTGQSLNHVYTNPGKRTPLHVCERTQRI